MRPCLITQVEMDWVHCERYSFHCVKYRKTKFLREVRVLINDYSATLQWKENITCWSNLKSYRDTCVIMLKLCNSHISYLAIKSQAGCSWSRTKESASATDVWRHLSGRIRFSTKEFFAESKCSIFIVWNSIWWLRELKSIRCRSVGCT